MSASRIMAAISSTVGKDENSSGVWMNSAVIRISTEKTIETASSASRGTDGSGRMSTTMIAMTPIARPISVERSVLLIAARLGNLNAGSLIGDGRRSDIGQPISV